MLTNRAALCWARWGALECPYRRWVGLGWALVVLLALLPLLQQLLDVEAFQHLVVAAI